MKKKIKSIILMVLILAMLVGLGYVAYFGVGSDNSGSIHSIDLGLDLAGGVSITYEVDGDENPDAMDMSDTIYKLQKRVEQYSTEALVYKEGTNRINIEIPGVSDANAILADLGQPGNLYFVAEKDADGNPNYGYGVNDNGELAYMIPEGKTIESLQADGSVVLAGSDVEVAEAVYQNSGTAGNSEPVVSLTFTKEGAQKFADATTKAYAAGETIGIYYDGSFISVPKVQAAITDGKAVITGSFDYEGASNLASILRIGGLKLQLKELRSNVVGAQLGSDAIHTSLIAAAVGFGLVVLFMLVIYWILGLSASIALGFYCALMVILLSAFEITLTLPGIAGIILSIGMAVDANVLVFARIREEISAGKSVEEAMKAGYSKALSAILDGNITTLIAAVVLGLRGTGTVKGFAQTLALGIIVSMFTALVVTRVISRVLYGMGLSGEKIYGKAPKLKNIDFVGKRKLFFAISIAIALIGFVTMGVNKGRGVGAFNYSLDFVGGTSTSVTFNEPWTTADLDAQIVPKIKDLTGVGSVQVQTVSGGNQVVFKTTTLELDQRQALEDMFVNDYSVAKDQIAA